MGIALCVLAAALGGATALATAADRALARELRAAQLMLTLRRRVAAITERRR